MGSGVLWNVIGSSLYAIVSMILGTLVIRVLGPDPGGIFFFAFSTLGQHVYVISYFGMRAMHSTDTAVQFTFGEYRKLRLMTAAAGLLAAVVAALAYSGFSYKAAVIIIVASYRVLDGYADIYECEMQRDGRLDLTGKSMAFRTLLTVITFVTVMVTAKSLILSSAALTAALAAAILIFDVPVLKRIGRNCGAESGSTVRTDRNTETDVRTRDHMTGPSAADHTVRAGKVRKLFSESIWLFAAVFLDFFVFAASKYAVDAKLSSEMSGYYSTLFLPASAMLLFANFVVRPLLPKMSETYLSGDKAGLKRMLGTGILVIAGVTVIAAVTAYFIGVQVLCIFAGPEAYEAMISCRFVLALIVTAGGIYGMLTPLYYALVIGKQQTVIFRIYLAAAAAAFALAFIMVESMGLTGAAWSMVISMAVLFLGFYAAAARKLWKA